MPSDIKKNIKDTQELEISVFSKYTNIKSDLDLIIVIIILNGTKIPSVKIWQNHHG